MPGPPHTGGGIQAVGPIVCLLSRSEEAVFTVTRGPGAFWECEPLCHIFVDFLSIVM